jgi:hypothetical protein
MVPMVVDNGNTMKAVVVEVANEVDLIPTIEVIDNNSLVYNYIYMYFIILGNRGGTYRGGNRGGNAGYNVNGYQKSSQYQQNNEQQQQQVRSAPPNQQQ